MGRRGVMNRGDGIAIIGQSMSAGLVRLAAVK